MAKARAPVMNYFSILGEESLDTTNTATRKPADKKPAKKADDKKVVNEPVGMAALTPAAKAQAKKAKETVEKVKEVKPTEKAVEKQASEVVTPVVTDENKKMNREQWEQVKKHGKSETTPSNLPPRQQGDAPRGRGGRRGGGRRGGRFGADVRPAFAPEENRNRDQNQRGQNLSEGHEQQRGRENDRHSGMVTGRKPQNKRSGAGKGNWGQNPTENSAGFEAPAPAEQTAGWGDEQNAENPPASVSWDKIPEETTEAPTENAGTEGASEENAGEKKAPEPEEKLYDDYLEQRKKQEEELAKLLGNLQKREVVFEEDPTLKPVENNRKKAQETVTEPAKVDKKKKEKVVKAKEIPFEDLSFKVPPHETDREGRGRRGGRGGRRDGDESGRRPRDDNNEEGGFRRRAPREGNAEGGEGGYRGGRRQRGEEHPEGGEGGYRGGRRQRGEEHPEGGEGGFARGRGRGRGGRRGGGRRNDLGEDSFPPLQ